MCSLTREYFFLNPENGYTFGAAMNRQFLLFLQQFSHFWWQTYLEKTAKVLIEKSNRN
jgi:hypothetical protein